MQKPFNYINSRIFKTKQFNVTCGTQPTWALFYVKSGSFNLTMQNKTLTVGVGDTVIFSPNIPFKRRVNDSLEFVYVEFSVNEKSLIRTDLPVGKINFKNLKQFKQTISEYEKIINEFSFTANYYKQVLLDAVLLQILYEYGKTDAVNDGVNIDDDTVNLALNFIKNNLNSKLSVEKIAINSLTNPSTLNFKFRKFLNYSVMDYVTYLRIETAKKLLENTAYKIGEIALKVGFINEYYFSTAFKKYSGNSPSEYRKKYSLKLKV